MMTVEEALAEIEAILEQGRLNKVQDIVFRQSWEGHSYMDIAKSAGYDPGYIKDTGSKLWKLLSDALGEKVTKQNLQGALRRMVQAKSGKSGGESGEALSSFSKALPLQNLPVRDFSELIGRDREIQQLIDLLSFDSPIHCVSIEGIGGMGKTTLALSAAYSYLETCRQSEQNDTSVFDAIVFTSAKQQRLTPHGILPRLRSEHSLQDLFRTIARTFNRSDLLLRDFDEQLEQIQELLSRQRTLLVIDNLETVEDTQAIVAFLYDLPLLVKVVITSRQQVPFTPIHLKPLTEPEGIRLMQHHAQIKGVSLTLEEAQRLHQSTSGVPAAIVYALGQLAAGYPLKEVPFRLTRSTGDYSRFYFASSVMPLKGKTAHQLLMALALFSRPAVEDAIAYIAGSSDAASTIESLAQLQQLSLVRHHQERYDLLALTREYAIAELTSHASFEQQARERWIGWYLNFAQMHGSKDWKEWNDYEPLEQEWENLQDVIEWCIAHDRYEDVRQFWQRVNCYTHVQGYRGNRLNDWRTRLDWADWLIQAAEQRQDWKTVLEAVFDQGWTLTLMGQPKYLDRADALYQRVWEIRHYKDAHFQIELAIHIAVLRIQQQQFESAIAWLEKAQQLLESVQIEEALIQRTQIHLGYYHGEIDYKTGNNDSAKTRFQQVLEQAESTGWQRAVFLARDWLADIAIQQGNFSEAQRLLTEGLWVAEANRDRCRAAFCQRSLAHLEKNLGNRAIATRWAEAAKQSFEQLGMISEIQETMTLLQLLQ
jgi:LuxR family glucitol operon transcriptional activator